MRVRMSFSVLAFQMTWGLLMVACDKGSDAKADPAAVVSDEKSETKQPDEPSAVDGEEGSPVAEALEVATDANAGPAGGEAADAAADASSADRAPAVDEDGSNEPTKGTASAKKNGQVKPGTQDKPAKIDARTSAGLTLTHGKAIFAKRCRNCHGDDGAADTKMGKEHDIPDWTQPGWKSKWPLSKIEDITANGKPGTKMKAFSDRLAPEELHVVSRYAHSLGK